MAKGFTNSILGGIGEGLYIWKKYKYTPEQTFDAPTLRLIITAGSYICKIESDDFNVGDLPDCGTYNTQTALKSKDSNEAQNFIDFINGFVADRTINISFKSSVSLSDLYLNYNNTFDYNVTGYKYSNNVGYLYLTTIATKMISETLSMTKNNTATIPAKVGDFLGYVVSNDENEYPDGGVQGGYWYERVNTIASDMDCGTVTITSSVTSIVVEHNLGVIPTQGAIVDVSEWSTREYNTWMAANSGFVYYGGMSTSNRLEATALGATFLALNTTFPFTKGHTFLWVVHK